MSAAITCFANIKGGVGKTTLVINVAHTLATELGQRVLVVDMDPQINATTALFPFEKTQGLREKNGSVYQIFTRATGFPGMDRRLFQSVEVKPVPTGKGFDLILGALDLAFLELRLPEAAPPLDFKALGEKLQAAGWLEQYDHILIDTPPTPSFYLIASLKAASHFVIPTRYDHLSVQGVGLLARVYETLRAHQDYAITAQSLGVVITLVQNPAQLKQGLRMLEDVGRGIDLGDDFFKPFDGYLPLSADVGKAQAGHRLIRELPERGNVKAAQVEMLKITSELSRRLKLSQQARPSV
jgi:chromosome partitioning protein